MAKRKRTTTGRKGQGGSKHAPAPATSKTNAPTRTNNNANANNGNNRNNELRNELKIVAQDEAVGYMNRHPTHSPLYETDEDGDYVLDKETGERIERDIPDELDEDEADALQIARENAHRLEHECCCCGLPAWFIFRKTVFIGFILPFVGDIFNFFYCYFLVNRKITKADVPCALRFNMFLNLLLAEVMGLVPVIGDLILLWYMPCSRNVGLFEQYLQKKYKKHDESDDDSDDEIGCCDGCCHICP